MRHLLILCLALLPTLPAQVVKTTAVTIPTDPSVLKGTRIARGTFTGLEQRFDGMLSRLGNLNEPIDPLGATRGVYLDGYGAVITAELGLVLAPSLTPFRTSITPEMVAQLHRSKVERLPVLRVAMKEMLRDAARTLIQVPENQLVVLVVRLDYMSWENTSGLPGQILMRADRKSAMAGEFHEEVQ